MHAYLSEQEQQRVVAALGVLPEGVDG